MTSMQLVAGALTTQTLAIAGIALILIFAVGAFYLRRRRK
jgi:LPXTG-motif cell wall-anchored protein